SVLQSHADCPDLRSFPTRRSSDLGHWQRMCCLRIMPKPVQWRYASIKGFCQNEWGQVDFSLIFLQFHEQGVRLVSVSAVRRARSDRKSTRLNSSHVKTSYAVFCLQ